ncbi:MAG: DUF1223 domain-containing protein [Alphaproteobacteria bacterium]|nr:DUF1223 domain-containing protein [Alphaproteobacteria bacterium]
MEFEVYRSFMTQNRRHFLKKSFAALSLIGASGVFDSNRPAHAADNKPLVVVELFTSQGCSSCPPAEAFLNDLANRDDVLALEFHVDYWDYIGWKDPFANPDFTARQWHYNTLLGSAYNYTPQMVIDGRAHEVGSRRSAVEARIEAAAMKRMMRKQETNAPEIIMKRTEDGGAIINLNGKPEEAGSYDLLLVGFDAPQETEVLRGENSGKHLVNAHVVRALETLSSNWHGGSSTVTVSPQQMQGSGGCAVLAQNPDTGTIAAAAKLTY